MSIPDFQSILLPLLIFASDRKKHSIQESIEYLSKHFSLTENERKELLPSGKQSIFDNRVGWSRTHLKKADYRLCHFLKMKILRDSLLCSKIPEP